MKHMIILAFAAAFMSMVAPAGFTPVLAPPAGELNHAAIFENSLGLPANTIVLDPNNPFSYMSMNGLYTMRRVDDFNFAVNLHLCNRNIAGRWDQVWQDGQAAFTARARYAAFGQTFGWSDTSNPGWNKILTVNGQGFNPATTYHVNSLNLQNTTWTWERANDQAGLVNRWSSLQASNNLNRDHMVSYLVSGPGIGGSFGFSWWVFWEDLDLGDQDYNDLVVEIMCIPAPAALTLGLLGCTFLGALRRRLS